MIGGGGGMFFGTYTHSLDAKGRLTLPARYRASFETRIYASQHMHRCVALRTPSDFGAELTKMRSLQEVNDESLNLVRVWAQGSQDLEIDRQNRIALPLHLRQWAGLSDAVLINGAIDRIELWSPDVFSAQVGPSNDRLARLVPAPAGLDSD